MSVSAVRAKLAERHGKDRTLASAFLAAAWADLRQDEMWPFTAAPGLGWRARGLRLAPLVGIPLVLALVVSMLPGRPAAVGHAHLRRTAQPAASPTPDYAPLQSYGLTDPHLTGQPEAPPAATQETDDGPPGQAAGATPAGVANGQAFSAVASTLPGLLNATAGASLGSFTYTANADGTVNEDPAWVKANITTQAVPILGPETCNKAMFPQLIGALTQLQQEGLSGLISTAPADDHPSQCYQSRFANSNPALGLSFHAWGIAIDINATENPEGKASHQDPRLVAVFQQWGFRWGGAWAVPDPMHFELAEVHVPSATNVGPPVVPSSPGLDVGLAPSLPAVTGAPLVVTATVSGAIGTTATVTFRLFGPQQTDCSGTPLSSSTTVVRNGVAAAQPAAAPVAGTYHWTATLVAASGASAGTQCGTAPVTVTDPPLVLKPQAPQDTLSLGSSASLNASLGGGNAPSGGTLSFLLYGPNDGTCASAPLVVSSHPVTGDGVMDSGPVTPTAPGTYQWVVTYSGDGRNPPSSTACGAAPLTIAS